MHSSTTTGRSPRWSRPCRWPLDFEARPARNRFGPPVGLHPAVRGIYAYRISSLRQCLERRGLAMDQSGRRIPAIRPAPTSRWLPDRVVDAVRNSRRRRCRRPAEPDLRPAQPRPDPRPAPADRCKRDPCRPRANQRKRRNGGRGSLDRTQRCLARSSPVRGLATLLCKHCDDVTATARRAPASHPADSASLWIRDDNTVCPGSIRCHRLPDVAIAAPRVHPRRWRLRRRLICFLRRSPSRLFFAYRSPLRSGVIPA